MAPLSLAFLFLCFSPLATGVVTPAWGTFTPAYLDPPALPRQGPFGVALPANGSFSLGFWGGIPDPSSQPQCTVSEALAAQATLLTLGADASGAPAVALARPDAPLAAPLSSLLGAAAPVPGSPTGRLVYFGGDATDVLLWDSGALAPVVCAAPLSPRPPPRASAGFTWLASCNATGASVPCFVLYGGEFSSGVVAGDMWFLFGAEAPLAKPPACSWAQVTTTADALPPLAQMVMVSNGDASELYIYGGVTTGGAASSAVYRFAPRGFADAAPETEMRNVAQPHDGITPFAWASSQPPASTGWGGYPSRAIDNGRDVNGNILTNYFTGDRSCQHSDTTGPTPDMDPWWGLDLKLPTAIDAVMLWQRTDCCRGRFAGLQVWVSNTNASNGVRDSPGSVKPWAADGVRIDLGVADLVQTSVLFRMPAATVARFLWVYVPGRFRVLTLCEVQVFQNRAYAVRNLAAQRNVALGKPVSAPFTIYTNTNPSGQWLPYNVVDGIVDQVTGNGASQVQVLGPTGAAAASDPSQAAFVVVDLGAEYDLGSGSGGNAGLVYFPSNAAARQTRLTLLAGLTRDVQYMTTCFSSTASIEPLLTGGGLGTFGRVGARGCTQRARYVGVLRTLINNPAAGDGNALQFCELQAWASLAGAAAARKGAAGARWGGSIFVFGGYGADGTVMGELAVFDIASNAWVPGVRPLGSAPSSRAFAAMLPLPPLAGGGALPSNGIVVFGGTGASGPLGDAALLSFARCPPLSTWGATSIVCDAATGTVCKVTCLPTWRGANPGSANVLTCGADGTWGLAVLPPCAGIVAAPPPISSAVRVGSDATRRGVVNVTFSAPTALKYVPMGERWYADNAGGDMPNMPQFLDKRTGLWGPTFPGQAFVSGDFRDCWRWCNQTVGCMAYAFEVCPAPNPPDCNLRQHRCWLKQDVRAWNLCPTASWACERISGDLPNPLLAYRVSAVPAGLTDFFPGSQPASDVTPPISFTAASSSPAALNPSAVYSVRGVYERGGSVTGVPTGIALDVPESNTCSWYPSVQSNCLTVVRPWPSTTVPLTGSWAVETFINTPSTNQRSLQASQFIGLCLYTTAGAGGAQGPILWAGLLGTASPTLRSLVFGAVPYTIAQPPLRSTPWTATSAFLRLERSAATASIRLGYRLRSTDIWTYHVWISEAAMYGGGIPPAASLFVGFVMNNGNGGYGLRGYGEAAFLRFTALSDEASCPSLGARVVSSMSQFSMFQLMDQVNSPYILNQRVSVPGLTPTSTYTFAVEALTSAGWGVASSGGVVTIPAITPSWSAASLVDSVEVLKPTGSVTITATSGTSMALAIDNNPATGFTSTGRGVFTDTPGERLTISLGQKVSVANVTLYGFANPANSPRLRDFQVIVHNSPTDWLSGYSCAPGLPSTLPGGRTTWVACGTTSSGTLGRYVTLRNGQQYVPAINPTQSDGVLAVAEFGVRSLSSCGARTGTNAVAAAGAAGAGCAGGPLGTACTLACVTAGGANYAPAGGVAAATCTGDGWSDPPLICQPLCEPLPTPDDMAACSAVIFFDAFEYTSADGRDGAAVALPPSAAALWTPLDVTGPASNWGGAWSLSAGRIGVDSLPCSSGHVVVTPSLGAAAAGGGSYSVLADVFTTASGGLVWGALDVQNYYRGYVALGSTVKALVIERVVGGSAVVLASASAPLLAPGERYRLNLTVTGSTRFTLQIAGSLVSLTTTDATPALTAVSTAPDVGLWADVSASFDNFEVRTYCYPGGVTIGPSTARLWPGASLELTCAPGFAPAFSPFVYTCRSTLGGGGVYTAALSPPSAVATPNCTLAPPIFPQQTLYVNEGSQRGSQLQPPLKATMLSPQYSVSWALGSVTPARLQGAFSISSCTGEVELLLDNKLTPAFRPHWNITITVVASVLGYPQASSTRVIPLVVVPQDQLPVLASSTLPVVENSLGGTFIGTPEFFDWDVNWTVPAWKTYTWSWADSTGGLLTLDAATGAIAVAPGVTSGQLNYEGVLPTHSFGQVTRITQVNRSLFTSTATITIALQDANDAPQIVAQPPLFASESLFPPPGVGTGVSFGLVQAFDEDSTPIPGAFASPLTFSLVQPSLYAAYNACTTIARFPTVDGRADPTSALLFAVTSDGNVTMGAVLPTACAPNACISPSGPLPGWSSYTAFQVADGSLMRGAFQVCVNVSDAFGGWGVGAVEVQIGVASGASNVPLLKSWACTGPAILISNDTGVEVLPTQGGSPGADVCMLYGTGFSTGTGTNGLAVSISPFGSSAFGLNASCTLPATCPTADTCQVACTPPPGVGGNLAWLVLTNPGTGAQQQAFDQSNKRVFYAPPELAASGGVALTADGGTGAPLTLNNLPPEGGALLVITGANFGPIGSPVSLKYGPAFASYTCTPLPGQPESSGTVFRCLTPAGYGAGLPWTLTVGGQPLQGDGSNLLSYTAPTVLALRAVGVGGVVFDVPIAPDALLNVSTDGSETVYMVGTALGPAPSWSISAPGAPGPAPLTNVTGCVSLADCPCPLGRLTCWSFSAPAGTGLPVGLAFFSGNQAATPAPLRWGRNAPVVTSLEPLVGGGVAGVRFPTRGGVAVSLRGRNFGPGGLPSPPPVAVAFGLPSTPLAAWLPCAAPLVVDHWTLNCTLPEGSGAALSVAVTVDGVTGITPGVLSYDPPRVSSATSSYSETYAGPGLRNILRSPTVGGANVTIYGENFGVNLMMPSVTSPANMLTYEWGSQFTNCAFFTWAQRQGPTPNNPRGYSCNGGEDWLGEGEVDPAKVLVWTHTQIVLSVPPGVGEKELQLSIGGALLMPMRAPAALGANLSAPPPPPTPELVRLWYADPEVYSLRACKPRDYSCVAPLADYPLVDTDGGTLLRIDGANFGPPPMGITQTTGDPLLYAPPSPALAAIASDVFGPPIPLALAPVLITSYPVVTAHRSCTSFGVSFLGGPAPPSLTVAMPLGGAIPVGACVQGLVSVTHNTILFMSPPGVGVNRSASVSVVSDFSPPGQQRAAGAFNFSYAPPVVTGFQPPIVPLGFDTGAATIVMYGKNFGNDEYANVQGWTDAERRVGGGLLAIDGSVIPFVSPQMGFPPCTRSRLKDTSGAIVTVLSCGVNASAARAGFANVDITVAGQRTSTNNTANLDGTIGNDDLVFACLQGYYAHMGETCLPCPTSNEDSVFVGAECATPHPGYFMSPDPLNFLTPPPLGRYVMPAADFPKRFLYPRPLLGWYNLNSSDRYTLPGDVMAAACPPDLVTPGRDVCIVPCSPTEACLGDNVCALGYTSKAPFYRCASCDKGFYASAGRCIRCPDSPAAVFVVFALLVLTAAAGGYWLNKHQVNLAMIAIGVDFFQVLAIFSSANIKWPRIVLDLLRVLSAFNLNIEIVAPECLVPNVTFTQKFVAVMLLPLVVGGLLGGIFLFALAIKFSRGHRDKKKLYSHAPSVVSSSLVLIYLLYLYLTRTALDVFNCAPTSPPDGKTYLQVVFEACDLPGGVHLTMWPLALAGLAVYTVGYPAYLVRTLWLHRELAMEDQLLRAKGVGNDKLSNPNALWLRTMFGRSYYQFKPQWPIWIIAILLRKFAVAATAVVFNRSVNFQMAACLLIMFLAYAAQVQNRPYMSPNEFKDVLAAHEAAAASGDARQARLKSNIAGVEARGRKKGIVRSLFNENGKVDALAALAAVRDYAFNFNTVEATMLFCIVVVCLMALMYQANSGTAYYPQAADSITSVVMLTIIFGIIYFFAALGVEVASSDYCKRNAKAVKASSRLARGPPGPIESSVNPMFLNLSGKAEELGSKDSLIASILQQAEAPPRELWLVFRDEFAVTLGSLKEAQAAVSDFKEREQKRGAEMAFLQQVGSGGGGGVRREAGGSALAAPSRREFAAGASKRAAPDGGQVEMVAPSRPSAASGLDFARASPLRLPKGANV